MTNTECCGEREEVQSAGEEIHRLRTPSSPAFSVAVDVSLRLSSTPTDYRFGTLNSASFHIGGSIAPGIKMATDAIVQVEVFSTGGRRAIPCYAYFMQNF